MKIAIIGAGPAGSTTAYELAKQGHSVSVFEENVTIGRPIQCTGIVTRALFDFVEKDENYIVNELEGVKVIAPSGNTVHVPLKEWVICREKFDNVLARKAQAEGAKYFTRHKFMGLKNKSFILKINESEIVEKDFDMLIGADGPFSAVGRAAGLLKDRQYYIGSQATIKASFDPKWFLTFFGEAHAPHFFAWVVPENREYARVGVATKKQVHTYFDIIKNKFNGEIVERQAGAIPIYSGAKNVQRDNIFLVGDAAGVCKNTTGGGIITGMWSAKILANCIKNQKNYSSALNPLRRELWIHKKLRNMLNKFSDKEYEYLVHCMSSPKVKHILKTFPREYPSRFMTKLLFAQPKLALFAKYILT